jgi:hypothetical protein
MKTKAQGSVAWWILGIGIVAIIGLIIYSNYSKLTCSSLDQEIITGTLNSNGKCCENLVAKAPEGFTGGAWCVNPSDEVQCLKFTENVIPVEGVVRISSNGTMFPLKQVAQCPTPSLTESICTSAGGHWNNCGSRCFIDHQGEYSDIDDLTASGICPTVCEAICECGGIAGFNCPSGFTCKTPSGVADAMGYCVEIA